MPKLRPPRLCRHRAKNLAYIRQNGRQVYLGPWDSSEAKSAYDRLCRDWRAAQEPELYACTLGDLTLRYLEHAEVWYRKGGERTSEVHVIRNALRPLNDLFAKLRAADLRPRHIKEYRMALIRADLARTTINKYVERVRRALAWAIAEELLPSSVLEAIKTVPPLTADRTQAREPDPVTAVPDALVDAIRPHVSGRIWTMIALQRCTGMRPGEVLLIRGCDLDTSGDVWQYRPRRHKLQHKGIGRIVLIGPTGQQLLKPLLTAEPNAYLFSPDPLGRRPYRRDSYTLAIRRGCELAFGMPRELRSPDAWLDEQEFTADQRVKERRRLLNQAAAWRREHVWRPNQLRHSFASKARAASNIESVQALLGHASVTTTEKYAEVDLTQARLVASKIG